MKKVLLATTALTLSAGFAAAAELTITGSAELGINDNGTDDVQFFQDMDVTFKGSGTTDGGLSFGFAIDLDEGGSGARAHAPEDDGGASIFISGDFGTLTMGDTDGAFDWALTETASGGSIDDAHTIHAGYNGNSGLDGSNDGQVLRYDNTFGDFGVAISMEQDATSSGIANNGAGAGDVLGLGLKGSFGDFNVGLGFQDSDADDIFGISLGASLGMIDAVINYSDRDTTGDHIGLGVTYSEGPMLLHMNYGEYESGADGFGLAANYDLGGGAEVQFGYGSDNGSGDAIWSLGVAMSF